MDESTPLISIMSLSCVNWTPSLCGPPFVPVNCTNLILVGEPVQKLLRETSLLIKCDEEKQFSFCLPHEISDNLPVCAISLDWLSWIFVCETEISLLFSRAIFWVILCNKNLNFFLIGMILLVTIQTQNNWDYVRRYCTWPYCYAVCQLREYRRTNEALKTVSGPNEHSRLHTKLDLGHAINAAFAYNMETNDDTIRREF